MEEKWKWLAVIVGIIAFGTFFTVVGYKETQVKGEIQIQKTKQMELENERLRLKGQQ